MNTDSKTSVTRRLFLHSGLAAAATLPLASTALAAKSANSQIRLGLVGCGGRGGELLRLFSSLDGVEIAGLCDPDQKRLDNASKRFPKAQKWTDMREMFDSKEIDAVVITTCNHWHALAAIWAMEAGKHVYVEKPLSHLHWEGAQVVKAAEKYGRICQLGTQQRSNPMQADIKKFLHEEKSLGEIEWVRVNRFGVRGSIGKRSTPLQISSSVDTNLWFGPAQKQELYRNGLHYDWHWDWNTGSGEMGNWGVHILDDVRNNIYQDEVVYPRRIAATGGRYAWNDAGNTPNLHFAVLDTGAAPTVVMLCNLPKGPGEKGSPNFKGPGSGYIAYCEGGRLEGHRGGAIAWDADGKMIKKFRNKSRGNAHQQNFIDAVRKNDEALLNAPVRIGHHSTAWCNFANLAFRANEQESSDAGKPFEIKLNKEFSTDSLLKEMRQILSVYNPDANSEFQLKTVLDFDAKSDQFVGNNATQVNSLLRTAGRGPFVVPEI